MREVDLGFNPSNSEREYLDQVFVEPYMRAMIFWDGNPYVVKGDNNAVYTWINKRKKQYGKPMFILVHYYATKFGKKRSWTYDRLENCMGLDTMRTDSSRSYIERDYYHGPEPRVRRRRWVFVDKWNRDGKEIILETRHIPKKCPREIKAYLKRKKKT